MARLATKSEYALTATPYLFPDGEFAGRMKSVNFSAQSQTDTQRWFTVNFGQFEGAFRRIMPPREAKNVVTSLERGAAVEFQGLFVQEQFVDHFAYRMSDIYMGDVIRSRFEMGRQIYLVPECAVRSWR